MFKTLVAIVALSLTGLAVNGQQKKEPDVRKDSFGREDQPKSSGGGEPGVRQPGNRPQRPSFNQEHGKFLKEHGKGFGRPGKFDGDKKMPMAPMWKGVDRTKHYHHKHGHKFPRWHPMNGKFFYAGHNHHHWTYWTYSQRFGVHFYWDPWARNYFYWCAPDNCYYPVSYVPYGTYSAGRFDPIPPPFPGR